jgi:predicted nucleotidyltransferase
VESVIFDVGKFLGLCSHANPNALEVLFADERDWMLDSPAWRRLHQERHRFLTRKVQQTFLGYALAQLKRIRTHRSWLLSPPAGKPRREDWGLPTAGGTLQRDDQRRIEQAIGEKLRGYGVDDIEMDKAARIAVHERMEAFVRDVLAAEEEETGEGARAVAAHALSLPADVVSTLNAERSYRAAMKHWASYESWLRERNPARAELEREHGYDTKHAMHLIRLMRMGLQALERGDLSVRREDAAELVAIRLGALSFEALLSLAEGLEGAMKRALATTLVPDDVDRDAVDRLALGLMLGGAD